MTKMIPTKKLKIIETISEGKVSFMIDFRSFFVFINIDLPSSNVLIDCNNLTFFFQVNKKLES
jgi:hypothetical protein